MNKEYKKKTEVEGYLTGDGDCTLIASEEDPLISGREDCDWMALERRTYFYDIIPEEIKDVRDGKYKFKFIVRAEKSGSDKTRSRKLEDTKLLIADRVKNKERMCKIWDVDALFVVNL